MHDTCNEDVNQRKDFVIWDITMNTDGKKTDNKIIHQRTKGKEIVNKDFIFSGALVAVCDWAVRFNNITTTLHKALDEPNRQAILPKRMILCVK